MARCLRIEYPNAVYHVTSHGNAPCKIFRDDQDRGNFFSVLGPIVKRYNWLCHAYCLMHDHYYIVIETPDANLSWSMRQLNGVYTQKYNRRHGKPGHVFEGRYKAILVEKDTYLLELCRYVVLNPLCARLLIPGSFNRPILLGRHGRKKRECCPCGKYSAGAEFRGSTAGLA